MAQLGTAERPSSALRRALVPLALAQFICSFAGSNMNVMINDINKDLNTTVQGVQIAITLFLLVMAALAAPPGPGCEATGDLPAAPRRMLNSTRMARPPSAPRSSAAARSNLARNSEGFPYRRIDLPAVFHGVFAGGRYHVTS